MSRFQHWLGNIRRLPGTEELALARLDQDATGDQIAELLGRAALSSAGGPGIRAVSGQPILQRAAGAPRRPRLGRASRRPTRRAQPGAARRLARVVGPRAGDHPDPRRRRPPDRPADAGGHRRRTRHPERRAVREAIDAGVVVLGGEAVWFRHPLLADVLTETYLPGEATPVHAAWAAHLETVPTDGIDELRRLGDLASHHERAGDASAAFAALLQGADLAEKLGARREAADLLARAADLWEVGADPTDAARPRTAARTRRARLQLGRSEPREPPIASRRARPRLTRTRPALGKQADAAMAIGHYWLGEAWDRALAEHRTSRRPLPGRPRQPRTRRRSVHLREHLVLGRADCGGTADGGRGRCGRPSLGLRRRDQRCAMAPASCSCGTPIWSRPYLDAAACWEHALASGEPVAIGNAYLVEA